MYKTRRITREAAAIMKDNNTNIALVVDDARDHTYETVIRNRVDMKLPVLTKSLTVINDKAKLQELLDDLAKDYLPFVIYSYSGMIIDKSGLNIIKYDVNDNTISFKVIGDDAWNDKIIAKCKEYLTEYHFHMKWYYNEKGAYTTLPVQHDKQPVTEMYPFLGDETLTEYYDRYTASSSSILLLIGPPGTGKTTFIKGLLDYSKSSAILTYNTAILNDDEIFVNFLTGSEKFMIMEDCDTFLESRKEGNTMMHRFLNVSDGLVSVKNKKIIFTTNLENTNDIDPALLRAGRCFDVLHFDELSYSEAEKLAKKFDRELPEHDKSTYTIAEVFCDMNNNKHERKMGFQV